MNVWVLLIIALVVGLVVLTVLPKVRGIGRAEKTTIERRSGKDRRHRKVRVPAQRRRRDRRAQDAAKAFMEGFSE